MDFRDELKEYILNTIPDAKLVSGGREILMRCRFCGDSADPTHKHFYIGLGYDNKPIMFNCFKCGESGILTPNILRELDLIDYSIAEKAVQFNKQVSVNNNRLNTNAEIYYISNSFIRNKNESFTKRDYINSRLGLNLSFSEMIANKIVLNLFDLLNRNQIPFNSNNNWLNELDQHFVGFLSEDNNFLIERNVDSSADVRYFKYNIHGKINTDKRYYILPCNIDLTDPRPINVHIAEGPFDILSIKYNVVQNDEQNLFIAIGGKAYKNIVRHVLSHMGLFNVTFHLYVDADIQDYIIRDIVKYVRPFNSSIFIHRNGFQGQKDYGVSKDLIIDNMTRLS